MGIFKSSDTVFFLSSFPKSGNTWLRFILANIYNQVEKRVDLVDFHTIHKLIPETGTSHRFGFKTLPEIRKTHDDFHKKFQKVILVVRNPVDTINSYYHYLRGERERSFEYPDLLRDERRGIPAIISHTNNYVRKCERLTLVTYEQLHSDAFFALSSVLEFMGLSIEDDVIKKGIESSSFQNMRKTEDEKGRPYGKTDFKFTRSGKVGEGNEMLSDSDRAYVLSELINCPVLNLLYRKRILLGE